MTNNPLFQKVTLKTRRLIVRTVEPADDSCYTQRVWNRYSKRWETIMKTLVIYFSQTGNTKMAAEKICDGIKGVTGQCDLVSLEEVDASSLAGYDLVGLGCPTFYYQEPFNVRDFMEESVERSKSSFSPNLMRLCDSLLVRIAPVSSTRKAL